MVQLKTIIVDDEQLARELLRANLQDMAQVEVIAECANGREALKAITELTPDLVFLDIQMPGMNGFDLIKSLQADIVPMIIFTTAYDQYAIKAFDVNAVDYILKPLDELVVERAVKRAVTRMQQERALSGTKQHLLEALGHLDPDFALPLSTEGSSQSQFEPPKKLAIKDGGVTTLVAMSDIDWIDAAGDFMCVHCQGKTHVMRSTMKDLLDHLDSRQFKRIHRSTIVNLSKIVQAKPHIKGEYFVDLECGEQLKVSRSYNDVIKTFLS